MLAALELDSALLGEFCRIECPVHENSRARRSVFHRVVDDLPASARLSERRENIPGHHVAVFAALLLRRLEHVLQSVSADVVIRRQHSDAFLVRLDERNARQR